MRRRRWLLGLAAVLALNASLWLATAGFGALPRPLLDYFFGPKLVRAEVIVKDGSVLHDYRIDRGRIRAVSGSSVTLLARDGTLVTIPVAPGAQVRQAGAPTTLSSLRRNWVATTIRDGNAPAEQVLVTRR